MYHTLLFVIASHPIASRLANANANAPLGDTSTVAEQHQSNLKA